jgi:hypothetical protein
MIVHTIYGTYYALVVVIRQYAREEGWGPVMQFALAVLPLFLLSLAQQT